MLLQTPLSETPEPLHSRVMPMRANASSQNSRTLEEEQIHVNTKDSKIKNITECAIPVAFASSNHEVIRGLALIGTTLHTLRKYMLALASITLMYVFGKRSENIDMSTRGRIQVAKNWITRVPAA